jgi:hypothetical protein
VETTSWGGLGDVFFRLLRSGWESEWGSVGFQDFADEWAGKKLALVRGVRLMRVWKGGVRPTLEILAIGAAALTVLK